MNNFEKKITQIGSDTESGSVSILNQTILAVEDFLEQNDKAPVNSLITTLNTLLKKHSHFSALFHFINELFLFLDEFPEQEIESIKLMSFLKTYQDKWNCVSGFVTQAAINEIDFNNKTVLLHSNSTTIHNVFEELSFTGTDISFFQTASAPVEEGKTLAKLLAGLEFKVNYIADAAVGRFIDQIDLVIVGADAIFKNKFLNKIGTYLIALACRNRQLPFYVIADSRKLFNEQNVSKFVFNNLTDEDLKPADELWNKPPNGITPLNYYFEFTPNNLVTKFIFESGTYDHGELNKLSMVKEISKLLK